MVTKKGDEGENRFITLDDPSDTMICSIKNDFFVYINHKSFWTEFKYIQITHEIQLL